mmetsp:Transcript_19448/g.60893  ORF Transcript_19448/g.60893 Transcript_19448/m.60893 type:complete len:185 (-) Transcript_19448:63-617(-)
MLLCGAPPFWGASDAEILRRVRNAPLAFPEGLFRGVSDDAKALVAGLLDRDVDRRLTADAALAAPWIASADTYARTAADAYDRAGSAVAEWFGAGPAPEDDLGDALRRFARLNAFSKLVVEVAAAQLPPDRLVALRDDFLAADRDGDGALSLGELRAALGGSAAADDVEELFDAVDVDASHPVR